MYGSFAINILMSGSLAQLWSMINCLQLIVKMPLFNLAFPANAQYFYNFVNNIATFNILPTNTWIENMFNFNDDGVTPDNFQTMGYGNANIVENLGTSFFFLLGLIGLILIGISLKFLSKYNQFIDKVYKRLAKVLFYNMILRTFLESYLEFYFGSLLQIQQPRWDNASETFASLYNIILIALLTVYPFFVAWFFQKRYQVLQEETIEQSYGSLYESINTKNRAALFFNLIYLCRRMLFAVMAVFSMNSPNFQIQIMVLHSIFVLAYIVLVLPFETMKLNYQEIFNEICIIGVSYHLFVFTDYVGDPDLQYQAGWSVIGLTLLNIFVNMMIMFIGILIQFIVKLKKIWNKPELRGPQHNKANTTLDLSSTMLNLNPDQSQMNQSPDSLSKTNLDMSLQQNSYQPRRGSLKKTERRKSTQKNSKEPLKNDASNQSHANEQDDDIFSYNPSNYISNKNRAKSKDKKSKLKRSKTQNKKDKDRQFNQSNSNLSLNLFPARPGQQVYKTKEEFLDFVDPNRFEDNEMIQELQWQAYLNYWENQKQNSKSAQPQSNNPKVETNESLNLPLKKAITQRSDIKQTMMEPVKPARTIGGSFKKQEVRYEVSQKTPPELIGDPEATHQLTDSFYARNLRYMSNTAEVQNTSPFNTRLNNPLFNRGDESVTSSLVVHAGQDEDKITQLQSQHTNNDKDQDEESKIEIKTKKDRKQKRLKNKQGLTASVFDF